MKTPRLPASRFLLGAATGLLVFIALSQIFLTLWLPRHGAAALTRWIEATWPVLARVDEFDYDPWNGLRLEQLRVADRVTGEAWLHVPSLQARVAYLPSLARLSLVMRGSGMVRAPMIAHVDFNLRIPPLRPLALRVSTREPVNREHIMPPLAALLPAEWLEGRVLPDVELALEPDGTRRLRGVAQFTGARWKEPDVRHARFDLDLDLVLPAEGGWRGGAGVRLHEAALQGQSGQVRLLDGIAFLTPRGLQLDRLDAQLAEERWRATGEIYFRDGGPYSHLLFSRPQWTSPLLAQRLPPFIALEAQPDAELRCLGSPRAGLFGDCAARLTFNGGRLVWKAGESLNNLTGVLDYDLFTRMASMRACRAQWKDLPLAWEGRFSAAAPYALDIAAVLETDLARLPPDLLPRAIAEPAGAVRAALAISGTASEPLVRADAVVEDAGFLWREPQTRISAINGAVAFESGAWRAQGLRARVNAIDVVLDGTLQAEPPHRLQTAIRGDWGRADAIAAFEPDRVRVESAQWRDRDARNSVDLRGAFRLPPRDEALINAAASLDLAAPPAWLRSALPAWPAELSGQAQVQAHYAGPLKEWRHARIEADAAASPLRYKDWRLDEAAFEVRQSEGDLWIDITRARSGNGSFSARVFAPWNGAEVLLESAGRDLPLDELPSLLGFETAHIQAGLFSWDFQAKGGRGLRSWRGKGWARAEGARLGQLPLLNRLFGRGIFGSFADAMGLEKLRHARLTSVAMNGQLHEGKLYTKDLRLSGDTGGEYVEVLAAGTIGTEQGLDSPIELYLEQPSFQATRERGKEPGMLHSTVLFGATMLDSLRRQFGYVRIGGTLRKPERKFEFSPVRLIDTLLWPITEE